MTDRLQTLRELAPRLAETALANIAQEYPYDPGHVVRGPDGPALPRELHPVFYGSFDWHSAVHMHWLLVRLLRRFPDRLDVATVRARLDVQLTPAAVRTECDYLRANPGFERPYGWAWLLILAAECTLAGESAAGWRAALEPAVASVDELSTAWLKSAVRPVRAGTHANTAFALGLLLDAAEVLDHGDLARAVRDRAAEWFLDDRDAPARWEPDGHDFLSPALAEADLVRRLLPADRFSQWWQAFLPELPPSLQQPTARHSPGDGQAGHLWGLDLYRAAAFTRVAAALDDADRAEQLRACAQRHLDAGLVALDDPDYQLRHWVATFAALALDPAGH
ncbi:MAG TPA: DUF2891 domain-containing protein [Jatrophihabitans sp.]|jgi:hypothetical protein